jgi:hypothetical protein
MLLALVAGCATLLLAGRVSSAVQLARRGLELAARGSFAGQLFSQPTHSLNREWHWQNPLPQGNTLYGVNCPDRTTCYAVGDYGTILATTNGTTWNQESSGTTAGLNAVSCPHITTCFVVGDYGTILSTTDGRTWTHQVSGIATTLNDVSCASSTACFSVGIEGTILATTDGRTWNEQSSDTTGALVGVSCPSVTICFAVGAGFDSDGDRFAILLETRNGKTWIRQRSGARDVRATRSHETGRLAGGRRHQGTGDN